MIQGYQGVEGRRLVETMNRDRPCVAACAITQMQESSTLFAHKNQKKSKRETYV